MSETSDIIDGGKAVDNSIDEAVKAAEAVNSKYQSGVDQAPDTSTDGGISFSTIEVGGVQMEVYKDGMGHTWQVPANNVEDFDDLYAPDPYSDLPKSFTEIFDLIGVHKDHVKDWMQKKYVPVYQKEVGISEEMARMTGTTLDSVHTVGDLVLMKIPKVINQRRQAAKIKETKRRLETIEPTAEMEKAAQATGIMTRFERRVGKPTLASESPGHILRGDDKGNYNNG